MPPESVPAPKRQIRASDLNVCHPLSLSANTDDSSAVSDGEHKHRMKWFMFPLVKELGERVERAYVNDLEQQMRRDDLSLHEQRECAEFFHAMLESIRTYLFNEDTDWADEILSKKPRGAWYRRWLDGSPYLLKWATSELDDSGFGVHLRPHCASLFEREQFATLLFQVWKLRTKREALRWELELKARLHSVRGEDAYRADLAIGSVDKGKGPTIDWQRLQDECVLTWKYQDLPLNSHEVDAWLEKRLKLATFPCDFSPLRVIRWTDEVGNACGARVLNNGAVRLWLVYAEEGKILNSTWSENGISTSMIPLTHSCSHGFRS